MSGSEPMSDRAGIVIAKLNWSEFYQGEADPKTTFEGADNYERFNFKRVDGRFYGSIPRRAPQRDGKWLVLFIARDTDDRHYAVGWYEDACFTGGDQPEYRLGQEIARNKERQEIHV